VKGAAVALLALLVLSTSTQAKEPLNAYTAFREACRVSRYNCWGLSQPMVRYSSFVDHEQAYGIYIGGRTIWLSPTAMKTPEEHYIVMVHEMVHYLQAYVDQNGLPFETRFERCVREFEAFEVSDKVAKRLNVKSMIRNGDLKSYGC
jgi:hypothetical protein